MLFLGNTTRPQNFLTSVNVPFDATFFTAKFEKDGLVHLDESYRVSPHHPIRVVPYATWTRQNGLDPQEHPSLHARRTDMEGIVFQVGSLEASNKRTCS